jgi:hypothetical protein
MKTMLRFGVAAVAILSAVATASAQAKVKIGVLGDMSGPYADFGGHGSVEAVKLGDCQEFCVWGRVDHHALTNRSSNMMANWVFASHHSRGGIFHVPATWRKTR